MRYFFFQPKIKNDKYKKIYPRKSSSIDLSTSVNGKDNFNIIYKIHHLSTMRFLTITKVLFDQITLDR